jgi:hypothetical protein
MVNKLLEANRELFDYFQNDFFYELKFSGRDGFKEDISHMYFIYKSTRLFKAIQILCGDGVGDGATAIMLVRGLFELLIGLKYINIDDKSRAHRVKLFSDSFITGTYYKIHECENCNYKRDNAKSCDKCHFDVWVKELNNVFEKYYPTDNPVLNECIKRFKTELDSIKDGKSKKEWSGKTRKQMAYECGLLRSYLITYWHYSNLTHPSIFNMTNFLLVNDGACVHKTIDMLIESGPQAIKNAKFEMKNPLNSLCDTYVEEALAQSFNYYSQILEEINLILNPKLNEKLNLIVQKHPLYSKFETR